MKYQDFRAQMAKFPYFGTEMLYCLGAKAKTLQDELTRWQKKGLVHKLRRGLYTLNDKDRLAKFSNYFIANQICTPSYLSLEAALGFYFMIPEAVFAYSSITTKKTQEYHNHFGAFYYRNLDIELFSDFISLKDEFGRNFYIASPEKALVDFLFFKLRDLKSYDQDVFSESFRLQNLEQLKLRKLLRIAKKFESKKLLEAVEWLIKLIKSGDL